MRGVSPAFASAAAIPCTIPTSPPTVDPIVTVGPLCTEPMLVNDPRMDPGMDPLSSTSPWGNKARSR